MGNIAEFQGNRGISRPSTSTLPPTLMPLVATDYTLDGDEKPWSSPRSVTVEQHRAAHNTLERLDAEIVPCTTEWLSGRIATLLAHFYVADTDPMFNRAVAGDWLKAMSGLPQYAVAEACERWLKEKTTKPKPADIRQLSISIVGKPWIWQQRLREVVAAPVQNEGQRRAAPYVRPPHGSPEYQSQRGRIDEILKRAGITP